MYGTNLSTFERKRARVHQIGETKYRGTSLIRNRAPLGPYGRTMPRTLWEGVFLMSEVTLYTETGFPTASACGAETKGGPGIFPGTHREREREEREREERERDTHTHTDLAHKNLHSPRTLQ